MGLFGKSSHDQGKEDGAKGNQRLIAYATDEEYRKGYDYGEGLKDGSKLAKSEDGHPGQVVANALFCREGSDKLGKSEDYQKGYDRGKDTYKQR